MPDIWGRATPEELDLYRRQSILGLKSMRPETIQATFSRLGNIVPPPTYSPQPEADIPLWQKGLGWLGEAFAWGGMPVARPFIETPAMQQAESLRWQEQIGRQAQLPLGERIRAGLTQDVSYLKPGGALREKYREMPWYAQLAAEMPAIVATGGITATGLRAALAPTKAIVPRVARAALKPAELAERAIAKPLEWAGRRVGDLITQLERRMPRVPQVAPQRVMAELPIRVRTPQGTIQLTAKQLTQAPSKTRAEIAKAVDDEFFRAIWDSPLDDAATQYLKTGYFNKYIEAMPTIKGLEKLTTEEAKAVGIALRTTAPGRLVPALRRSGFYASEDFAKGTFRDIPYASGFVMDPTRMCQAVDSGFFGGMTQKYVLWPTRRTALASLKFSDTYKYAYHDILEKFAVVGNKTYRQKVGDVIQHISHAERDATVATLLKKPDILKFINRYTPELQRRIVKAAKETRKFFDDMLDMQNAARTKRGQEAIAYRDNYRPWVIDSNIWSRTFGLKQRPADIMRSPAMPDYIKPVAPFNPRAQARTGGMYGYEKERDILKLVDDYIDTATKDIFNTNIIHNAKIHSATLRSMGFPNSSRLVEDWVAEAYAGIAPAISRVAKSIDLVQARVPMFWLRRRLTAAVFPLNWTWNAFIQTSSGALTVMRYGVRNTLHGLDYLFTKSGRDWTRDNAYSWIIKKRMGGSVAYQDIGAGVEKVMKLEAGKLEKAEHYANFLTHAIEEKLTGISVRAAYHDGIKKGFSGRALIEYASEGGAKTQSMYNLADLPGWLRAKEVGAIVPFQTFAFEVFNSIRELNIIGIRRIVGKAGAYETTSATSALGKATVQRRVKMLFEWIACMTAINVVVDMAINRKPWSTSSFIPFFAVLTGGVNAGNPWNQILPLKYSQDLKSGMDAVLKYGNWDRLRKWAIGYHMIGGTQINRTIQGLEAVIEGKVTGVAGQTLFEVNPDEALIAILMGPYRTEEGKEYIDKMQQAKGPGYEYTGIPMPKIEKTPEQQIEDAVWAKYPASLKKIADQIKELEKTNPVEARRLQKQHPQILLARRHIAQQKALLKRRGLLEGRQELLRQR